MLPLLESVKELANEERALVAKHMAMPTRPQTVSWRLLGYHATYIELFADILIAKAKGHSYTAKEAVARFEEVFGKYEIEIERYYDQANTCYALGDYAKDSKSIILE